MRPTAPAGSGARAGRGGPSAPSAAPTFPGGDPFMGAARPNGPGRVDSAPASGTAPARKPVPQLSPQGAAELREHPSFTPPDLSDLRSGVGGSWAHVVARCGRARRRRQGGDRPGDDAHRLLRQNLLFRRVTPTARRRPPVERGDWIARRPKSVARYRQLLVTVPDVDPGCRERNRPRLAVGTRAGAVYEDPEQPRLERRPRLDSIDPL